MHGTVIGRQTDFFVKFFENFREKNVKNLYKKG